MDSRGLVGDVRKRLDVPPDPAPGERVRWTAVDCSSRIVAFDPARPFLYMAGDPPSRLLRIDGATGFIVDEWWLSAPVAALSFTSGGRLIVGLGDPLPRGERSIGYSPRSAVAEFDPSTGRPGEAVAFDGDLSALAAFDGWPVAVTVGILDPADLLLVGPGRAVPVAGDFERSWLAADEGRGLLLAKWRTSNLVVWALDRETWSLAPLPIGDVPLPGRAFFQPGYGSLIASDGTVWSIPDAGPAAVLGRLEAPCQALVHDTLRRRLYGAADAAVIGHDADTFETLFRISLPGKTPSALGLLGERVVGVSSLDFGRSQVAAFDLPLPFHRGDPGGDGKLSITDAVQLFDFLFRGGAVPGCLEAADANDDGKVNISDPVFLLRHLFQGGPPPKAPGLPPAACGFPPPGWPGDLGCDSYGGCR